MYRETLAMMNNTMKNIERLSDCIKWEDRAIFEKHKNIVCSDCDNVALFLAVFLTPFSPYSYCEEPQCIRCIKKYSFLDSYQKDRIGLVCTTLAY